MRIRCHSLSFAFIRSSYNIGTKDSGHNAPQHLARSNMIYLEMLIRDDGYMFLSKMIGTLLECTLDMIMTCKIQS